MRKWGWTSNALSATVTVDDEWQDSDVLLYWGKIWTCVCNLHERPLPDTGLPGTLSPVFWRWSNTGGCKHSKHVLVNALFLEDKEQYDAVLAAFVFRT